MKIRSKATTTKHLTIGIASTLSLATILGVGIYSATNIVNINNADALSYSTNQDISFTFAPTLSIGLSTNSLTIDNLVPGTTSDSNTVTVTVSSNTPYGYALSAGVGSTVSSDPYYNTSDLVHDNSTTQVPTTNKFSSIATSASLQTLDTDNTWGYSTSTDGGTSWSTYSGLSHTETKPLLDISDPATPSTIDFKIAARSASTQASGTYNNVITFYAVGKPKPPQYLYDEVAKMSKGTQTVAQLQETITAPTATDYTADTSNSGVYEYNSSVFGEASDASNANKIYYYRGILEPEADQGSYGSDGKAITYPNYVRLANNTCWRIVRTTGSGGVKMIYNGIWQGTTEFGTCANDQTNAELTSSPFNTYSATVAGKSYTGLANRNMHAIGYTYSNVASTASPTALSTLLGATGNDTTTNTNSSTIKQYIEDWYSTNMVNARSSSYTSILEESAGYCNDRSVYNKDSYAANTVLPDSTTVTPYGYSGMKTYKYGAFTRNMDTAQNPSLTCPRGIVDTYSTTTTSGGNGQLTHPIALLTADEASFAGSGSSTATDGPRYNAKSFLRSGKAFWLLSPYDRSSGGIACGLSLYSVGILYGDHVGTALGVRPAISLKPGTVVADGEGTATDPWTIDE